MDPIDQNPYAAPQARTELAPTSGGTGSGPQPWDIGEVISQAWQLFTRHWGLVIGTWLVAAVASWIVQQVAGVAMGVGMFTRHPHPDPGSTMGLLAVQTVLGQLVQAFFQVGLVRIWLSAARGGQPTFATFTSGGGRYLTMLVATLAMFLAIGLGLVFFIVPGVILALGLVYTQYFAADTELGPIECLQASWKAMSGQKGAYFLFAIVLMLLNVGGAIACLVGLFVTIPLSMLAQAIVFVRITGRTTEGPADGQLPGLATS